MAQDDKTNNDIEITRDNAILLLAAAQELDLPPEVVETTSEGHFRAPQEVVDKAGLGGKRAPSEAKVDAAAEAVLVPGQQHVEDPAHPEPEPRTAKRTAAKPSTQK